MFPLKVSSKRFVAKSTFCQHKREHKMSIFQFWAHEFFKVAGRLVRFLAGVGGNRLFLVLAESEIVLLDLEAVSIFTFNSWPNCKPACFLSHLTRWLP